MRTRGGSFSRVGVLLSRSSLLSSPLKLLFRRFVGLLDRSRISSVDFHWSVGWRCPDWRRCLTLALFCRFCSDLWSYRWIGDHPRRCDARGRGALRRKESRRTSYIPRRRPRGIRSRIRWSTALTLLGFRSCDVESFQAQIAPDADRSHEDLRRLVRVQRRRHRRRDDGQMSRLRLQVGLFSIAEEVALPDEAGVLDHRRLNFFYWLRHLELFEYFKRGEIEREAFTTSLGR